MSENRLRVELFGPLRAYVDGREVELGPPKQRAAFALLAMRAGASVTRAELVDGVWGGSAPVTAAGSLHSYMSGLRRALGPVHDLLQSDRAGYRLRVGRDAVDAAHVVDLVGRARAAGRGEEAVAAYALAVRHWRPATPFAGVPGTFAEHTRATLGELRRQMVVEHAELILSRGEAPADLIDRLQAEVPDDPYDERLRTVLMTALHRAGRTGAALAHFDDLRRRLAADFGIGPSAATEAVYATVLDAEPRPPAGYAVPPPAQLPHDTDGFAGRAAELLAIVHGSAGRRHKLVAVTGPAGIGKTALAVRAATVLRDAYPDGQIYLDLRGFGPGRDPLTVEAALRHLYAATPRPLPEDHAERVALWRSLLATRRVLLILDNARSADQVEDLLPGGDGTLVVVTSRNPLSGLVVRRGAHRIALGPLGDDEAATLLADAIGADRRAGDPDAVCRVATFCAGSPLALRIAAVRIASAPGVPVAELLGRWEEPGRPLDALVLPDDPLLSVRAAIAGSVAALGEDAARAFRLLGVFPGVPGSPGASLTTRTAATLFDVGLDQAPALLAALGAVSLLTPGGSPDRFGVDALTHAYAAELSQDLDPDVRTQALLRVLTFYRATLSTWSQGSRVRRIPPIAPPRSDVPPVRFADQREALPWFEQEWRNVLALVGAAARAGLHDPAWHLTILMSDHFYGSGRPLDWLELLNVGMISAKAQDNWTAVALVYHQRGVAYSRMGRHETAERQFTLGLDAVGPGGDRRARTALLCNLSMALVAAKRFDDAFAPARSALALALAEDADYFLAYARGALCGVYVAIGDWRSALSVGLPGLANAQRAGSHFVEAGLLINVGLARHGLGQPEAAGEILDQALQVTRRWGNLYHEGLALFALARTGGPVSYARQALERFERLAVEEAGEVRAFLAALDEGGGE